MSLDLLNYHAQLGYETQKGKTSGAFIARKPNEYNLPYTHPRWTGSEANYIYFSKSGINKTPAAAAAHEFFHAWLYNQGKNWGHSSGNYPKSKENRIEGNANK